jgi:hypothetical protein
MTRKRRKNWCNIAILQDQMQPFSTKAGVKLRFENFRCNPWARNEGLTAKAEVEL